MTLQTTLATLAITLNGLKLPLTIYQLYAWAASTNETTEAILRKAYCLGLSVLAAPSRWAPESQGKVEATILTNIQSVALQWAKLYTSQPGGLSSFPPMLATAWAAQTVLWQLQLLPQDDKRSMILPRLAESMAMRLLQQNQSQSQSAEVQQLALRALRQQSKWAEILEILEHALDVSADGPKIESDFGVALTRTEVLKEKCQVLYELGLYDKARAVYEDLLLQNPDDWFCWKGHLKCCSRDGDISPTSDFVETILEKRVGEKYPLRGPHLIKVESAAQCLRCEPTAGAVSELASAIEAYAMIFGARAVCAFSDLRAYLDLLLSHHLKESQPSIERLLAFLSELREKNKSDPGGNYSNKERQTRLRAYIFAVKVNHIIVAAHSSLRDMWLPEWSELIAEWKSSMQLSSSNEGEGTQKEVKPGDDLIMLGVQQILTTNTEENIGCGVVCAVLLATAIMHSPDNAYLKMALIHVYYLLDSMELSWELFEDMGIKHIQLDSCIFQILPYLQKGGLYNEAVQICTALLRFHGSTARDCGDYAGKAMERGTLGKADEFLVFQREKMNKSLSVIDAKGVILDCAPLVAVPTEKKEMDDDPLYVGCLGKMQGIVGGDEDYERAMQMAVEVHNPYAALSVVSLAGNCGEFPDASRLSDNRDLSIQALQLLLREPLPSADDLYETAVRRGYIHGSLIRSTLCLNAAKGPKKGKLVKPSEDLEKRTRSLLKCLEAAKSFFAAHNQDDNGESKVHMLFVTTMLDLLNVLAIVTVGLPSTGSDSMEEREQRAFEILQTSVKENVRAAKETFQPSVKSLCYILPNFAVPLYASFLMCGKVCDLYGWGKRKHKSKRCAGALREVAIEFEGLLNTMLSCLLILPDSEKVTDVLSASTQYVHILDEKVLEDTLGRCTKARYRTRMRVEPILKEMHSSIASFTVTDE